MTAIQPISNKILNTRNTGYAALAGMCLTTASAMIKSPKVRKYHKPLAFVTAALTLIHLGMAEYHRMQWKNFKMKQENSTL